MLRRGKAGETAASLKTGTNAIICHYKVPDDWQPIALGG
jgi:hypothetical protein